MKKSVSTLCFILFVLAITCPVFAQYKVATYKDELGASVNMAQFNDPFSFNIQYKEAPHPTGNEAEEAFLHTRKLEAQRLTPVQPSTQVTRRGVLMPPEIVASFGGNNIITGTPLDNHLAVNSDEKIVSTINTHMLVTNITGFFLGSYPLDAFFQSVGIADRYFDPRVIYDPQQDRFILVQMDGSKCSESQILLAFSQTNDPKGTWNLYALDGCLDDDGTYADYPMISITDTELFLTYNEVNGDSTWQTGFMGTQIHQINKMNGFNGETLNRKVWRDIKYNGRFLRNICPVRNADESLPTTQYFLSDRNFDISNDTVFLLHLTGHQDDPDADLNIDYRVLDKSYGVPPYAVQPKDSMDTNDARILDAFEQNGTIQYVNNTMDFSTGRSAIFHGFIHLAELQNVATGYVIGHPTDYLGYPGLAWTGNDPSQQDAIIIVSHCSKTRNPGGSAIYSDGFGQYSDFITVIEGQRPVDMLTGKVERWGDYIGIQRLYHQPGSVWISCSYGRPGNVNEAWVAKLARQEGNVATHDIPGEVIMNTYPNPTDDYVNLDIENPEGKTLTVTLFDISGKPIRILFDGKPNYAGPITMSFSTKTLPAGQYVVRVEIGDKVVVTKTMVKM